MTYDSKTLQKSHLKADMLVEVSCRATSHETHQDRFPGIPWLGAGSQLFASEMEYLAKPYPFLMV